MQTGTIEGRPPPTHIRDEKYVEIQIIQYDVRCMYMYTAQCVQYGEIFVYGVYYAIHMYRSNKIEKDLK